MEWNGNTFPLEEISDTSLQCHYDNIGRSSLCFTEDITMELNHEYKYTKEINTDKEIMGGPHIAENNFNFLNESSANDYYLKDRNIKSSYNSQSINKINNCYSNITPIITHKYVQIKTNKELLEDSKINLRNKIEEEREKYKRNILSDKTKIFINNMATSICNFCNLMQLPNQNE